MHRTYPPAPPWWQENCEGAHEMQGAGVLVGYLGDCVTVKRRIPYGFPSQPFSHEYEGSAVNAPHNECQAGRQYSVKQYRAKP